MVSQCERWGFFVFFCVFFAPISGLKKPTTSNHMAHEGCKKIEDNVWIKAGVTMEYYY